VTRPDESIDFSARNVLYNLGDILLVQTEDSIGRVTSFTSEDEAVIRAVRGSGPPTSAAAVPSVSCSGSIHQASCAHDGEQFAPMRAQDRLRLSPAPMSTEAVAWARAQSTPATKLSRTCPACRTRACEGAQSSRSASRYRQIVHSREEKANGKQGKIS
jgi:hypothetical protein